MIILRESSEDFKITSLANLASTIYRDPDFKSAKNDEDRKNYINLKLSGDISDPDLETKVENLKNLIFNLMLQADISSLKFIDDIDFKIESKHGPYIEYLINAAKTKDIDFNNTAFKNFCMQYPNLYDRSMDDFKYTIFIANTLGSKTLAKQYFKNVKDIKIDMIIDNGKVMDRTDIFSKVVELEQTHGVPESNEDNSKSSDDKHEKKSFIDFLKHHKRFGSNIENIQFLYNLINKHYSKLKSPQVKKQIYIDCISVLLNNEKGEYKNIKGVNRVLSMELSNFLKGLFNSKCLTNINDYVKVLSDFDKTFYKFYGKYKKYIDKA